MLNAAYTDNMAQNALLFKAQIKAARVNHRLTLMLIIALHAAKMKIEVTGKKDSYVIEGTANYIKHRLRDYFDRVNVRYSPTASLRELIKCLERTDNCRVAVSFA